VILRNRVAYVLWGFAVVVVVFVATMTGAALMGYRSEPDSPVLIAGVLILFWFGAIGLLAFAAAQSATSVELEVGGGLRVTHRFPFRKESRHVAIADIHDVAVVEGIDDEGDAYFYARMRLRDGSDVDLAESHDRQRCEAVRRRFLSAIG
jgi:hypothetical protein